MEEEGERVGSSLLRLRAGRTQTRRTVVSDGREGADGIRPGPAAGAGAVQRVGSGGG